MAPRRPRVSHLSPSPGPLHVLWFGLFPFGGLRVNPLQILMNRRLCEQNAISPGYVPRSGAAQLRGGCPFLHPPHPGTESRAVLPPLQNMWSILVCMFNFSHSDGVDDDIGKRSPAGIQQRWDGACLAARWKSRMCVFMLRLLYLPAGP